MAEFEDIRDRLLAKLDVETPRLDMYDDYFDGRQPLKFLAPALQAQMGNKIADVVVNIPRFGVEAYDNRLDIQGFRFPGIPNADDDLWGVWQANDGSALAQQAHRESLALGRAYAIVGEGDDDLPLITVESPFETIHEDDPRTHEVKYGVKRWTDEDKTIWVDLFHPYGRQTWFQTEKAKKFTLDNGLTETNDFNLCRMVPLVNDPRTLGRVRGAEGFDQRLGRSVFHDVIGPVDALNKTLTDMMTSAEFHAMPRRWATGLNVDDFVDEASGTQFETYSMVAGRVWSSENENTKFGQFQEADLKNFHDTAKLWLQLAGTLLALPPHYLSFESQTPPSADAIRSAEAQLVKRAERKQSTLSGRWERVQRLVVLTQGRPDTPELRRIETLWTDPATPTKAQKTDAAVKLYTAKDGAGRSLIPAEQTREDLGYSPEQRARMAAADLGDTDAALSAAIQLAAEREIAFPVPA
ncbi:phage portal protein [Clavibacter capsici]|uniref:phage portal protein n=1 Tax=Clavibacter capsici TaxID=1874630 RepID=UPI00142871CD|nr:phage portal protein [Clavibacter capsici]QIS38630.1 phage portal protein [Clavibacter capsici]